MSQKYRGTIDYFNWLFGKLDIPGARPLIFGIHRQPGWDSIATKSTSWNNFLMNVKTTLANQEIATGETPSNERFNNFLPESHWARYDNLNIDDRTKNQGYPSDKRLHDFAEEMVKDARRKGETDTLVALAFCTKKWGPEDIYTKVRNYNTHAIPEAPKPAAANSELPDQFSRDELILILKHLQATGTPPTEQTLREASALLLGRGERSPAAIKKALEDIIIQ